jgi:hypothetical protein
LTVLSGNMLPNNANFMLTVFYISK